ncbi:protein BatD [Thiohalocapsa marina]|uniref:Protein BatD n=1 Tax=Thiohalocapsa marina TaxID=424902 RepID=A0A5M8FLN8_9GAMM|nr:BatD family protein [Thiohalocapsa marina]KAA6184031.1 protein BatD [Thiohalocapsa marina]
MKHLQPFILLLVGLWLPLSALAELRASFDRPQVYEGDTVTLTIEAEGFLRSDQPDLGVLADAFDVLGSSQGRRLEIINGRQSATVSWQILLSPRHQGEIQVPPIPVGDEQTPPLRLQVSEAPTDAQGGPGDDVYVEVELEVDGDSVLVQQQVPLVVRLFSALPIRGGELSDPRAEGAVLERLGPDSQYSTRRNGREYQVIERRFSLSPERSGELRIAPVVFQGELRTRRPARSPFDLDPGFDSLFGDSPFSLFERGEPVRARSQAITLQVQARPDDFGGAHWLPAEALTIEDSWAQDPPRLRVGEPVTRTLRVTAQGLAGNQIPQLDIPVPAGLRAYPEQTEAQSRTDGSTLFGVSVQRLTLIPTRGGSVEFPAIRVTWWDTLVGQERTTTVPALQLDVEGQAAGEVDASPMPDASAVSPSPTESATASPEPQSGTAATADGNPQLSRFEHWFWFLLVLAALLVLIGGLIGLGWRRRRAGGTFRTQAADASAADRVGAQSGTRSKGASAACRAGFQRACAANDAPAAAKALLAWAQALQDEASGATASADAPANLSALAARLDQDGSPADAAAEQVRALERVLYAPDAATWTGEALWRALGDRLPTLMRNRPGEGAGARGAAEPLAPLYPERR